MENKNRNLFLYLKYQANSILSVSLRSASIYIFTDSFSRFLLVAVSLGILEYIFSTLLLDKFQLNVIAFLIVGFGIYIIRFTLNRYYVFRMSNKNENYK